MVTAGELLSHPLVLRAAWKRVRWWCDRAEWHNPVDAAAFELALPERLQAIGRTLADGSYQPAPFPLIPFPKKGKLLRHYSAPAVADQVAFAVFAVLLGPLIDRRLEPFVFGNRLYRGLRPDPDQVKLWKRRAYELDPRHFYMPYRRDHGLFRRVAHWTATTMLGVEPQSADHRGDPVRPEDFERDALPGCCRKGWWKGRRTSTGYWARLDLQMAYPTITQDLLWRGLEYVLGLGDVQVEVDSSQLVSFLEHPDQRAGLGGYPTFLQERLSEIPVRQELATALMTLIERARWDAGAIDETCWRPEGMDDHLLPGAGPHLGLPTGLAISGLLLNAALSPTDAKVAHTIENDGNRWAFLRFADDMIVFARTADDLTKAVTFVRGCLEGPPERRTNLKLNIEKVQPDPIRRMLQSESIALDGVGTPAAGASGQGAVTESELMPFRRERLGAFVTHLVESMSRVAAGDAVDRFGDPATQRLQTLADLAALEIHDGEVRPDTRVAFAANRLATAFLPHESDVEASAQWLRRIRSGIATAIDQAPWKFSLWRAAIRAACRRVPGTDKARTKGTASEMRSWFEAQLRRVAPESRDSLSFGNANDEPSNTVRGLELSFLRATIWYELAAALSQLRAAQRATEEAQWSPRSWSFRAVDEPQIAKAIDFLSQFHHWAKRLYPRGIDDVASDWWWEWDAIALAALGELDSTKLRTRDLSHAIRTKFADRRAAAFGRVLDRALSLRWENLEAYGAIALLQGMRLRIPSGWVGDGPSDLAAFWCAGVLDELGTLDGERAVRVLATRVDSIWALQTQAFARRRLLQDLDEARVPGAVHEVVWSLPQRTSGDVHWRLAPGIAPAEPLPVRMAARMLHEALSAEIEAAGRPSAPRTWRLKGTEILRARCRLFDVQLDEPEGAHGLPGDLIELGAPSGWGEWGPHPVIELPILLGHDAESFERHAWAHIMTFLFVARGTESTLDAIVAAWPADIPLEERWAERSRVHLPSEVWRCIDKVSRKVLSKDGSVKADVQALLTALETIVKDPFVPSDLLEERVDVELVLDPNRPLDVPCTSVPLGAGPVICIPDESKLVEKLRVRLAQVGLRTDWHGLQQRFARTGVIRLSRAEVQQLMKQVQHAFTDGDHDSPALTGTQNLGPILLPEVCLPWTEFASLESLVRASGRSALVGFLWRETRTGLRSRNAPRPTLRYLVNEAVLAVPLQQGRSTVVRTFVVRKPRPAHSEEALARLGSKPSGPQWEVLPGHKWYRFVHPYWGDFTVAICSDLVDPRPWNAMQGQVLHLFMVSCNQDIDMFDGLTWVRAFELHANVAAVNQGQFGGSFVWTPESGHRKEIARLRGPRLALVADVSLRVTALLEHQRTGVEDAVHRSMREWDPKSKSTRPRKDDVFKAPPPGYRLRAKP